MSKEDTRYLGKVYKIYDNTNGNVYYGSTRQALSKRLQSHKTKYKQHLNDPERHKGMTVFQILKNDNYTISLVEEFTCQNREQLHARERHFIENFNCVNKHIPLRTKKEYYVDNFEKIAEYKREYYNANREAVLAYKKEQFICDVCGHTYQRTHKKRHERSKVHMNAVKELELHPLE